MTAAVPEVPARPRRTTTMPATRLMPHRLPSPSTEPPYDDERVPALRAVDTPVGQLELPLAFGAAVEARPQLRLVDDITEQPPAPRELPDPRPEVAQFVALLLDTLAGARPASALQGRASCRVYRGIAKLAADRGRRHRPGARDARPALRSVHVTEPEATVAEACAVVRFGSRCRAVALRFEGVAGRWKCTAIEMG